MNATQTAAPRYVNVAIQGELYEVCIHADGTVRHVYRTGRNPAFLPPTDPAFAAAATAAAA